MRLDTTGLLIAFVVLTHCVPGAQAQFQFECELRDTTLSLSPISDYHGPVDTVEAVALWITTDSTIIYCEDWRPESYDLPPWAESLWDSTELQSVTRFWLDNSNHKHLVTADTPTPPSGGCFVIGVAQGGWFSSAYADAAIDTADLYVDFSQYDHNSDGWVDQVFMYDYNVDGRGTIRFRNGYSHETNDGVSVGEIVMVRTTQSNFLLAYGLTCHEYGHTIRVGSEIPIDMYGSSGTRGLGSFEIMADGGFANTDNTDGRPSFFNPLLSTGQYWASALPASLAYATENVISTTQFNTNLSDYAMGRVVYRLDRDPTNLGDQFFYVTASHKHSHWEDYYPSTGILIWHADRSQGAGTINARWGAKRLDIEQASDLHNWTFDENQWYDTTYYWGSDTAVCKTPIHQLRNIGTRGQPNDSSGIDSLDVLWVRESGQPYRLAYEAGHAGSHATFFHNGSFFDGHTNPSSDYYATNGHQTINTGIAVSVISIDSADGSTTADLIVNRWSGTIPRNYTWHDTVKVVGNLTVAAGATLTIEPGTKVLIDSGKTITIKGTLSAVGTSASHIVFKKLDITDNWKYLKIDAGTVSMDYADIQDFTDYGIYTEGPLGVTVNHTTIDGSDMALGGVALRLWNKPTTMQTVNNTEVFAAPLNGATGMYLYNCDVSMDGVTIRDCDYVNSFIKKVTGKIRNSSFEDRTANYAVLFTTAPNTPNFKCCEFTSLAPVSGSWQSTIFAGTNTSPSFGGEGFPTGVSNVITDASTYLLTIQGSLALPVIDYTGGGTFGNGGHNDWVQQNVVGKFIEWRDYPLGTTPYKCEDQYWNPAVSLSMFSPATSIYWDYTPDHSTAWGLCGGAGAGPQRMNPGDVSRGERGSMDDEDYFAMYDEGLEMENEDDFEAAQELFHEVAANAPDQDLRWKAATHVVSSTGHLQGEYSWIPVIIDSLIAADNSYPTRLLGKRLLGSHYLNREDYDAGIETCVELLNSGLTFGDSLYVAMDLLGIQMAAGYVEDDGGLDESSIPAGLRVHSDEQGLALEQQLLGLLGSGGAPLETAVVVPTEYSLYQNYPNPFNPVTEIRFDLPENAQVEMAIFNTLGQKVATLIDEARVAGSYRVPWDGTNVASGVYLYRLKAGSFVETKKMVLMR